MPSALSAASERPRSLTRDLTEVAAPDRAELDWDDVMKFSGSVRVPINSRHFERWAHRRHIRAGESQADRPAAFLGRHDRMRPLAVATAAAEPLSCRYQKLSRTGVAFENLKKTVKATKAAK